MRIIDVGEQAQCALGLRQPARAILVAAAEKQPRLNRAALGAYVQMVGDPKQAIYRFRGADIAAYNEAIWLNPKVDIDLVLVTLPDVLQHVKGRVRPAIEAAPSSEDAMHAAQLPG